MYNWKARYIPLQMKGKTRLSENTVFKIVLLISIVFLYSHRKDIHPFRTLLILFPLQLLAVVYMYAVCVCVGVCIYALSVSSSRADSLLWQRALNKSSGLATAQEKCLWFYQLCVCAFVHVSVLQVEEQGEGEEHSDRMVCYLIIRCQMTFIIISCDHSFALVHMLSCSKTVTGAW